MKADKYVFKGPDITLRWVFQDEQRMCFDYSLMLAQV